MNKWLLGIAAIVLIVAVYYVVGSHLLRQEVIVTQDQAAGFAMDELRYTYPDASIDLYSITNVSNVSGEAVWKIMAKVVYGNGTVCPSLTDVELHYPRFGFVTRNRSITQDCHVLGCRNVPNCIIAYPEEAIIMPLDLDRNPAAQANISRYFDAAGGSGNVAASATYYPLFEGQGNMTYPEVWVISYRAHSLNYSLETILNKTGGIVLGYYAK